MENVVFTATMTSPNVTTPAAAPPAREAQGRPVSAFWGSSVADVDREFGRAVEVVEGTGEVGSTCGKGVLLA